MTCMATLWSGCKIITNRIIFASVRQSYNSNDLNVPENEEYPLRVVRGGAWGGLHGAGTPEGLRSAKRYAFVEWIRSFQIGFRCAMDFPEKN